MKLFLLLMLWVNAARIHGEEAFTCDNTGEVCPSKMCFYGIDHEHSCYRAGCDTKQQCAGRRHNECFIGDGLHICCCMERGCAARYKGLSDCVDEPSNSTDTDELTTPVTSEVVEEQTAAKVLPTPTSTEVQAETTSVKERKVPPISEEEDDYTSMEESTTVMTPNDEHEEEEEPVVGKDDDDDEEEETTTVAKRDTTLSAVDVVTQRMETPTSTEVTKTTTTAQTTTSSSTTSTSTQTSTTTTRKTTTSKATSPVTTATRTTTSYVPRTTRYTTTQMPSTTTTTAYVEQLRALPDMPHTPLREVLQEDSEEETTQRNPQTTSRKTTTTTAARTTTRATTTPVRIVPPMRKTPVNEPTRELEPARAEKSQFISPAVKSENAESGHVHSDMSDASYEETTTQDDSDAKPTTSLINVYEVTTLAVKNKEVHEQWKAPVPWWAAVAVGFLVSVVVAWAVVFYLRKKKLREAEAAHRRSAEKETAIATPLLKPSGVAEP